jgi:anaerobic magnesium-protoporphyrin IX monomethyl ester cyclase
MKILCLNGPFKPEHGKFSRASRSPAITKSGTIYYPIWLAYVTGVLEQDNFDVTLLDSCADGLDLAATLEKVKAIKPQLVVLDTSTPSIYADIDTGARIKELFPDCCIALIGTHPTALPKDTLEINAAIDVVVVGEADYTVRDLARAIKTKGFNDRLVLFSDIKGLAWRHKDRIVINPAREFIANLDELPFVSKVYKKHLKIENYFFAACDFPEVQIMTARGCIARCSFCVYPQTIHGLKYRTRGAKNIADEFVWIKENLPQVREVGIEDDVFSGSQKRVVEFCQELISRKIKLKWYCNVRADLKFETMQWMKKANCVLVTVGYESANAQILKNIEKNITPENIVEFSKNCKKAGLLVRGCFMAGNRGETKETLNESLDMALKIMDDTMQFFPLIVYPGTRDFDWAMKEKLISFTTYADYLTPDGNHNSVVRMPDMDSDEIRQWCDYARNKYYLRPRYIAYKFWQQLTNPSDIRRTLKTSKRFLKFLFAPQQKQ